MEYRFKKVGEVINGLTVEKYTSVKDFEDNMQVKEVYLLGRMGKMGVKTHAFKCYVVNENIVVGGWDVCGSSNIIATTLIDDLSLVTCSKCLKSLANKK